MRVRADIVEGRAPPRRIELDAASLDDARRQAQRLGYAVLACHALDDSFGARWQRRRRAGSGRFELPVFVEQLRDLLVAGLSVIEALEALQPDARGDGSTVIDGLARALRSGSPLSGALAQQPVFPALLVALVHAAELTSDLPQALARFLEHEQRIAALRHRVLATSIYPLLLCGVGALVLLFLLFHVMPRFARVFDGMAGPLPWSAELMLGWSRLLGGHAALPWTVLGVLAAGGVWLLRSPAARARALRVLGAWAPLRRLLHTYHLARWYRATGLLVAGGIVLPEALALAQALLPAALQPAGRDVQRAVHDGLMPSAAYRRAGMATAVADKLLVAGERSGELGTVLGRIAHFHDEEVGRTLERAMRAFEPIVMVLIGVGVGLLVLLMYLPIFDLASALP
ncbi:type II secretion system F family protein [Aquincola sp. S2]|uniref:Type II secretion system F family protein n=1 Tax=Pseudaquabacterium terrae TaxID=2732868 RepID=A0ABX2EJN9_9BURK|nr:type II secretion system F family protein [Aquabacterium terrae]NRF68877.1 type II secretion system F family protein [Aquabacterium terrae]